MNKYNKPSNEPNINRNITSKAVRLVDEKGEMVGIVELSTALAQAQSAGLDLVEVSPQAEPPVCKILDYGKYRYEAQRKQKEAKKKQKVVHLKEVKLRPNIGEHDYQVKMRHGHKFIEAGDKVKVSLRFRGREITHNDIAKELMERYAADLQEIAKVEQAPRMEGRQMVMILVPQ